MSAALATIISSAITGIVTLTICLITNGADRKRTEALIEYRIEALTKQVEKHNNVIEKVTELSINGDRTRQDVDALFKRVREMEKGAKP